MTTCPVDMSNSHSRPLDASYICIEVDVAIETDLLLERLGGYIVRCTWCQTDMLLYLAIS